MNLVEREGPGNTVHQKGKEATEGASSGKALYLLNTSRNLGLHIEGLSSQVHRFNKKAHLH